VPKREDIHKILIIGSGPIVIGQACEFDYSGTQACKALHEEGYQVVLVNSNPATIMTDPNMSDRTYIEPVTTEAVTKIIAKERPDALLPTLGGQTGLNTALTLARDGVLEKYGVEMIGATAEVIAKAENRELFKAAMQRIGLEVPLSGYIKSMEQAWAALETLGLPCVVRPSYTLGGSGGGVVYNRDEFEAIVMRGLEFSPVHEVLIEESVIGWKEFELEVMRDREDNVVIVCSIENFDPMGIHTGDSITVAPAQTLTDKEYQLMRDAAIAIMREIGVDTGGSNVQFAINPDTGRMVVIEMNPRVSRSSSLASKATGFPIAKIAAKLAVGYTLPEIPNDITRQTPACFEPTIDYVVTKMPRWTFEKFPEADPLLSIQMKSVGETMAIGRTFKESLQKALRGLETGRYGLGCDPKDRWGTDEPPSPEEVRDSLRQPNASRIWFIRYALKLDMSVDEIFEMTRIDPWFLDNVQEIVEVEEQLREHASLDEAPDTLLHRAKVCGFSDPQLAFLWNTTPTDVRAERKRRGIEAVFKLVDTCAAEFEAYTPYFYSTYEAEDESRRSDRRRIIILGGGPNRIGQGIEFDYCCCQAVFALRDLDCEAIMVNSNPETVSTDYDTSDQLFFEPLTVEDVLNICDRVQPDGVIVQFGGQTPLNLARALETAGVPILGTSPDSIELAEDRGRFQQVLQKLGLKQPANGTAFTQAEAIEAAHHVGFPVLVRPSFVLGGRAMEICYDDASLAGYVEEARRWAPEWPMKHPMLIDKFLEDATEVDVDALADGHRCVIGGIMQHIEEAGVHSGDSACALPPFSLGEEIIQEIREATWALAGALGVRGLLNIQFAIKDGLLYVLEVNPRASRTVPFVSKATGVPWAKLAAKIMAGQTLDQLGVTGEVIPKHVSVKESVFPFVKFPAVDIILGPEMRSTGEVMGINTDFGTAFAKAQMGAGSSLPMEGTIFLSVSDAHKAGIVPVARALADMGFGLICTEGTMRTLRAARIPCVPLAKFRDGHPNVVDYVKKGLVSLVINTPSGKGARTDEGKIRATAVSYGVPCITTLAAANAAVQGIQALKRHDYDVVALQDLVAT